MWMAIICTASLRLQVLVGGGTVWLYDFVPGKNIYTTVGSLAAAGYTQGPGQGMAMGTVWQNNYGIEDSISIGHIWGTIGFYAAYTVGIPYAQRFIKKGMNSNKRGVINQVFLSDCLRTQLSGFADRS